MPTLSKDRPEHPKMMWLGHYKDWFTGLYALGMITAATVRDQAYTVPLATAVIFIWLVAWYSDGRIHKNNLCERCIAASPLDPQKQVDKWKPALWASHSPWILTLPLIGVVAIFIKSSSYSLPWIALHVFGMILIFLTTIPERAHRKLYPWCPYCHWGDGGDEEIVPDVPVSPLEKV